MTEEGLVAGTPMDSDPSVTRIAATGAELLVRKEGLEPSRGYPLEPKSSASTSSATFA